MAKLVRHHAAMRGDLRDMIARRPGSAPRGFTLIELLVVLSIIVILIAILLPAIHKARDTSTTLRCLTNIKALAQSANAYTADNHDYMPNGTLPHSTYTHSAYSGGTGGVSTSWITTMSGYYVSGALLRSPGDPTTSALWSTNSGGTSVAALGTSGTRFTSYAINNLVTGTGTDGSVTVPATNFTPINQLAQVSRPAATVQWAMLTFNSPSTAASSFYFCIDHFHVELWIGASPIPSTAKTQSYAAANIQCQIAAYGGSTPPDGTGVSNYSYLDGHAETTNFNNIYRVNGASLRAVVQNRFDPVRAE